MHNPLLRGSSAIAFHLVSVALLVLAGAIAADLAMEDEVKALLALVNKLQPAVADPVRSSELKLLKDHAERIAVLAKAQPASIAQPKIKEMSGEFVDIGFDDINTALVNTMEFLQNQTSARKNFTKEEIVAIVEEVMVKEKERLKKEMSMELATVKKETIQEAKAYTDQVFNKLQQQIFEIQSSVALQHTVIQQITGTALPTPNDQSKVIEKQL